MKVSSRKLATVFYHKYCLDKGESPQNINLSLFLLLRIVYENISRIKNNQFQNDYISALRII